MKKNKYKVLWEKLKSTIDNQDVLSLMKTYEKQTRQKSRTRHYPIVINRQPWHPIYNKVREILLNRVYTGAIPKNVYLQFKKDFSIWMKDLLSGKITEEEFVEWLTEKRNEYSAIHKDYSIKITKPDTPSGFKRKLRTELSELDIAAIVIDDLVCTFKPRIPIDYPLELDVQRYEKDWRQDLWLWCWENRKTDKNLRILIEQYNRLPPNEYAFRMNNINSRMNYQAIYCISHLQYSCNGIAKHYVNYNYRLEESYPADDWTEIEDAHIVQEDEEIIDNLDKKELAKSVMNYFDKMYNVKGRYHNKWLQYKQIIQLRYGFNPEHHAYTLQEIGDQLGVTRERIRQVEEAALNSIREYLNKNNN